MLLEQAEEHALLRSMRKRGSGFVVDVESLGHSDQIPLSEASGENVRSDPPASLVVVRYAVGVQGLAIVPAVVQGGPATSRS